MKTIISKTEARNFIKRWKAVNNAEQEELRLTPLDRKFEQLAALMSSVKQMGWDDQLKEEDEEVINRWNNLRKTFHG